LAPVQIKPVAAVFFFLSFFQFLTFDFEVNTFSVISINVSPCK